jgi:hypothetical protein
MEDFSNADHLLLARGEPGAVTPWNRRHLRLTSRNRGMVGESDRWVQIISAESADGMRGMPLLWHTNVWDA